MAERLRTWPKSDHNSFIASINYSHTEYPNFFLQLMLMKDLYAMKWGIKNVLSEVISIFATKQKET